MSIHKVNFKVDDVSPNSPLNVFSHRQTMTPEKILLGLIDTSPPDYGFGPKSIEPKPYLEAVMEQKEDYYSNYINSFFLSCSEAYAHHLPLELDVDHVKLTITQAFAIHVNENSGTLRELLVKHNDKKKIIVNRNDFIRGQKNNWPEVFNEFAVKVKNDINDAELIEVIQSPTQTTTIETMAALNVSIIDSFQKFYDYTLMTRCGIPNITLRGSIDDWMSLKKLLSIMEKYDFKWYTNKMQTIIDEFILAAQGTANINFWKNMVKYQNMSGGPYYQGWIKYFFPYLKKNSGYIKSKFTEDYKIISNNIPSGLSSVPIDWIYYDQQIELKFCAGFAGIKITENNCITPAIMWCIQDIEKSKNNYDLPQKFIDIYMHGTYFNPAKKHYGRETRVICDMCKKDIIICVGYDKSDLCLDCINKIHSKYNN